MTRRARLPTWAWISFVLVGVIVVVLLVWKAPEALYRVEDVPRYRSEPAQAQAANARTQALATTRAALVAGLAGLAALGGLWLNTRTLRATLQAQEDARTHQQESLRLDREGHVTDRYTKAIDQIGSPTLDVRLGGIYALERLMADSLDDQPTIVEVLAAYVREHAPAPAQRPAHVHISPPLAPSIANTTAQPPADVQAALTVLARRTRRSTDRPVDLRNTSLAGAGFPDEANLSGAWLGEADLSGARLIKADLTDALLFTTNLTGAGLIRANLSGARLERADLSGAWLNTANLAGARLTGADLSGARLTGADLSGAWLERANLAGARLTGTNLTGARLEGADLTGAHGIDEISWIKKEPQGMPEEAT